MREVKLSVHPFTMGTDKEAALKPLEEAAELYSEWQALDFCLAMTPHCRTCETDEGIHGCAFKADLADEIADTIQACVNLAARYSLNLDAALERVEKRNIARGRYEDD
jgi:NTP pyrophosphatase (non-canonical NTP hydrolase)